ncbi:MAG TPA: hypothetical protein GX707_13050 [Epulopiscium sp.]|nr:hypothetical protein [Candidatus Epulonipiscium sp.]
MGPKMASSANNYFRHTNKKINKKATWQTGLSYDTMLVRIQNMLENDIPVIFSVGPNTPNLAGDVTINLYDQLKKGELGYDDNSDLNQYEYNTRTNGHYMTITGLIIDRNANSENRIMLCVSSWGNKYYINYKEYREYRDYIDNVGGTLTSSLVNIR